ncbi:hypothetical membrane protein, conserved [Thermococcus kodakarensis KOD1]|uniref:Hypothetical membrane protein, conserved n=1 Tax=Thermococcus kodakarensis (strain ATCC BAA-918 / JCM 12380 / KOD1) TaxID=69014 RepID=Q5JIM9_THEKO|nr:hypothetical protein [Thermococcus kodakarensis]WCN27504.1 hypothetical protein POG15_07930 [Thermococcus kodakarensis]WCN29794.1 hypothetical protein POG21_07920 [Thermococcus kodakarensis]BAD85744.1 hypothetical membrane protein, conserved [Thermococcus kodakarensis KOD1]
MRVVVKFPGERRRVLALLRFYMVALLVSAVICSAFTAFWVMEASLPHAIVYLVASMFFFASFLMYREVYLSLRKTRFVQYFRALEEYFSPPFGAYASVHVLASVIFYTADVLRGGYALVATLLLLKGIVEYVLGLFRDDLKVASVLYASVIGGDFDRLSLKDPFK